MLSLWVGGAVWEKMGWWISQLCERSCVHQWKIWEITSCWKEDGWTTDGTVNVSPNHTHSSSLSVTLTIACSILLSMATTLAPDALWGGERGRFNHESSHSCIPSNSDQNQHWRIQQSDKCGSGESKHEFLRNTGRYGNKRGALFSNISSLRPPAGISNPSQNLIIITVNHTHQKPHPEMSCDSAMNEQYKH